MRILIALVTTVFLSVSAYAQDVQKIEQKISNLKDKIAVLEANNQREIIETQYLDPTKVDKKILRLQDKLADLYVELAEAQGRSINLSGISKSDEDIASFSTRATTITPEPGDIIIFKPKEDYARWWAFAGHGWQHAAIFYSSNQIVQALQPGKNSVKMSWSDFIANNPFYEMDQVLLIKMNLSSSEKSSIQFYMDTFQIDVPYPSKWYIPFTKYSIDTFYCSSLVWAAHKWSGKKVDLDTLTSPAMVWPSELASTVNSSQIYSVSW